MPRRACLVLMALVGLACRPAGDPVAELFRNPAAWIDLTYPLGAESIFWPTATPFSLDTVSDGYTPGGYYYAAYDFRAAEHGGTHLDAPVHFAEGRDRTDEVPLDRLVGPAVVVDVADSAAANADYLVTVADLAGARSDR